MESRSGKPLEMSPPKETSTTLVSWQFLGAATGGNPVAAVRYLEYRHINRHDVCLKIVASSGYSLIETIIDDNPIIQWNPIIVDDNHYYPLYIIEGSLEVKLPTIWTVEKQRWEESEEKRSEERRSEEKESEERRCRCAKR